MAGCQHGVCTKLAGNDVSLDNIRQTLRQKTMALARHVSKRVEKLDPLGTPPGHLKEGQTFNTSVPVRVICAAASDARNDWSRRAFFRTLQANHEAKITAKLPNLALKND